MECCQTWQEVEDEVGERSEEEGGRGDDEDVDQASRGQARPDCRHEDDRATHAGDCGL